MNDADLAGIIWLAFPFCLILVLLLRELAGPRTSRFTLRNIGLWPLFLLYGIAEFFLGLHDRLRTALQSRH